MNYYEILNIDEKASPTEIKKAWKKLAKKYHPDVNKADVSKIKMQEINEAYECLSDNEKKLKYDISIKPKIYNTQPNTSIFDYIMHTTDVFKNARAYTNNINKGDNIILTINKNEIINNRYTAKFKVFKICILCNGVGCLHCKYTGGYYANDTRIYLFTNNEIETGVKTIKGAGNFKRQGFNGDVVININKNIYIDILVNLNDMYMGNSIDIETTFGLIKIKIPKKTQSGSKFRVKNIGKNNENIIINIMAYVPQNETEFNSFIDK